MAAVEVAGVRRQPAGGVDVDDARVVQLPDGGGDVGRVEAAERSHREDPGARVRGPDLLKVGNVAGQELGAAEGTVVGALVDDDGVGAEVRRRALEVPA